MMLEFTVWKMIAWAIGMFGVGGFIILCVVYPAVLGYAIKIILWLFSTRVGCALLAAILVGLAVDYMRHSWDDDEFAERTAAFEQRQKERDKQIADDTRKLVTEEIAAAAPVNAAIDQDVKEFHDDLPPVPAIVPTGNPFLVGDAACKLRHIAGEPDCGSRSRPRVPGAHTRPAATPHKPQVGLPGPRTAGAGPAQQAKPITRAAEPVRGPSN